MRVKCVVNTIESIIVVSGKVWENIDRKYIESIINVYRKYEHHPKINDGEISTQISVAVGYFNNL